MTTPARVDAVAATIDTAMRIASRVDIDASLVAGGDALCGSFTSRENYQLNTSWKCPVKCTSL
jgi:hypothetical protein